MPKLIKNLEQSIFNSAFKLFGEYGYEKVDMKMIAKDVDIAVGTLYNYYSNKKELFINVFLNSWDKTFFKIDNLLKQNIKIDEKLNKFISILYDDMNNRKGLGIQISKTRKFSKEDFKEVLNVRNELFKIINVVLSEYDDKYNIKFDEDFKTRLIETVIIILPYSSCIHQDDREKNIEFIIKLLKFKKN